MIGGQGPSPAAIASRPTPGRCYPTNIFKRSLRLARYTMIAPENGSSVRPPCAKAARECAPLRKSIGRVASRTRAPTGTLIVIVDAEAANRAQHRGQFHARRVPHDRTGKLDLDPRRARRRALNRRSRNGFAHNRNEARRCRRCRFSGHTRHVLAHRAAPAEYLLRTDLPPPRNLGHSCPWNQGLRDDPSLLIC